MSVGRPGDTLVQFLLTRLDQLESPLFLGRELEAFPPSELAALMSEGLLRETTKASEIPRPAHLPAGGDLVVRQTSRGLFGVADEDDYFDPIPLTYDDVRQYEVSLPKLAARIRLENGISGSGYENHGGLIPLGQKGIDGVGTTDVYLALRNEDESAVRSHCRRLERSPGAQKVILLTPRGVSLSPEGRRVLDNTGVVVTSLMDAAAKGTLALTWDAVLGGPGIGLAEEYPKETRIFQNQGKTWLVVYDGVPKSVGDSTGMTYIRRLLQSPRQEAHAATLRGGVSSDGGTPLLGSAGEVLDSQALREYKERISEIDEELAEAEANNDLARKGSLNEEREALYAEVGRATGLHGKNREASSDRERARQSVSAAIHRALRAIKKEHEPLWQHLHNSLKIGEFLSYQPDQSTAWIT
jgi:hypothetical protein